MTNLSEQATTESEDMTSPTTTAPKKTTALLRFIGKLIKLLIAIAIVATLGYLGYQFWLSYQQDVDSREQQNTNFTRQIQQLDRQYNKLKSDWYDYREALSDNRQVWQNTMQQRQSIVETRLDSVLSNNEYHWLFQEVQYWLHLAQQRINYDRNSSATIKLLKSAKVQLQVLDWQESAIIQQAIDKDISLLSDNKRFDKLSYYRELSQTQAVIGKALSIGIGNIASVDTPLEKDADSVHGKASWYDWRSLWSQSKIYLARSISVSNTANNKQFISRQQRLLLRQTIDLQFEQAKLAVLNTQWRAYEMIIKQIIDNLDKVDATEQQQWLKQLLDTAKNRPTAEQLTLKSLVTFEQQMKLLNISFDHE